MKRDLRCFNCWVDLIGRVCILIIVVLFVIKWTDGYHLSWIDDKTSTEETEKVQYFIQLLHGKYVVMGDNIECYDDIKSGNILCNAHK